jgi:hypothetical protein
MSDIQFTTEAQRGRQRFNAKDAKDAQRYAMAAGRLKGHRVHCVSIASFAVTN